MQRNNNLLIKKILYNSSKFPNKKILFDKYKSLTFSELIKRAGANLKIIEKIESNFIPIISCRNIDTVVAIISVILAKKVFCPISSTFPKDRIKYLIKKLGSSKYINCSRKNLKISGSIKLSKKALNSKQIKEFSLKSSNEFFYLLFTSGTTGSPKGVKLTFSNILNTILWSKKYLKWNGHKIGIATQFSFDISMFDLFCGLYFNIPMYIFSNPSNPFESIKEIKKNKITSIFSVPTFFSNFVRYGIIKKKINHLKRIISGGDFFPQKDILSWKTNQKNIEVFNVWGPTETSIVNTMYKIKKQDIKKLFNGKSIPVGTSQKRMQILIIKNKKKQPKNCEGEICMIGNCVSQGYIGSNKDSKNYFKYKGKRAYLTGDIGYFDKKNYLHILGRKDNTIKISGYRIDALEIQNLVNKISNVNNSLVVSINLHNIKTLCLAVESSKKIKLEKIKKFLQKKLPIYSIPKKIFFFKKFPLNNNNKIDKKKLSYICNGNQDI